MNLILPRRKFLIGSGQLLASLFVAPAIVPITNLMKIDSELNRLVVAFKARGFGFDPDREPERWVESIINVGDFTEPILKAWKACNGLDYQLIRRGEIYPGDFCLERNFMPGESKKIKFETLVGNLIHDGYLKPEDA